MEVNCSQCDWRYVDNTDDVRISCKKPMGIPCSSTCITSTTNDGNKQYYSDGYFTEEFSQFYKKLNEAMFTQEGEPSSSFTDINRIMNDTSINLQTRSTTLVNTVMGQGFEEQFFLSNGDLKDTVFSGSGAQEMYCGNKQWTNLHPEYKKYVEKNNGENILPADNFRLSPEFDLTRYIDAIDRTESVARTTSTESMYSYPSFSTDLNELVEDIEGQADSRGNIIIKGQWINKNDVGSDESPIEENTQSIENSKKMLVTFVSSCEETINDNPDVDANSICNTLYGVNYKDPSDEDVMNLMNDIRENTIKTLNDNSGNFDFAVNTLKNMNDFSQYPLLLTELQLYQNMNVQDLWVIV